MKSSIWKLNTSNPGKFEEFKRLFGEYGYVLETTHFDLDEIDADPVQVIVHKASQLGEQVIVEDTSLEIEGASIGVNIRWLLEHITQYTGHFAEWTVLLAYRLGNEIYIYKGYVSGTIVLPRGTGGFGFASVFLPTGATKTLAESKPNSVNARAQAIESLLKGEVWLKAPMMKEWGGPWQKNKP